MSCGLCVLISREHGNIVMRKDKLVELRAFMIPWGLGVYLQIILSTLLHILDFDSKVLASSMKRITEGLRPPRPFSARSYNRVSHADEILLDPSFLLGACTTLTCRKSRKDFCHKYRSMTFFFFPC